MLSYKRMLALFLLIPSLFAEHLNELDFNEELMLEKERQKLQRKLRELQEEEEKEQSEHIYIEKQVGSVSLLSLTSVVITTSKV